MPLETTFQLLSDYTSGERKPHERRKTVLWLQLPSTWGWSTMTDHVSVECQGSINLAANTPWLHDQIDRQNSIVMVEADQIQ